MNKKKIILAIMIMVMIAAALFGWKEYGERHGQDFTLYGNVDIRTVNLSFRVSGRLAELTVDEGNRVTAGQTLGQLDASPYQNGLLQAQANVNAMQANLSLLQAGYRDEEIAQVRSAMAQALAGFNYAQKFYLRQQDLWNSKATSANDLDNAKSARNQAQATLQAAKDKLDQFMKGNRPQQIEQAQATLQQAQAALAQAELDLSDTQLITPSNGVILTRAVEPGTMLAAGNSVFTLSLSEPVWVRAYVDEIHLSQVVPGTQVEIYTDGRPDKMYQGHIGFVSPTAEFTPKSVETPTLRTDLVYRLRIIVTDADEALRQGMPVTIKFVRS